jgi:hypothetical protein
MQDWIAFWQQHGDTVVHYVGVVIPWIVLTKLEFLRIVLSWPAVTLYLGTAFLVIHRAEIASFIRRIESGKWGPVEVRLQPQPKIEEPKINLEPVTAAAELVVQEKGDSLSATAGHVSPQMQILAAAVKELIKKSNEVLEALFFERTLNVIYGTQLRFLLDLKKTEGGMRVGHAKHYFVDHQRTTPAGGMKDFKEWVDWLITNDLVSIGAGVVSLTQKGRDLIDYVEERYPRGLVRAG